MFYLVFIFGLVFGSFLNSVIYRLKSGRRLGGRSFCPNCKKQLKWHDLIPILSFFWLKGYCRYCRKRVSWQYPIVEILSGIIWMGIFYKNFNNNLQSPISNFQFINIFYQIFILSALLIIAVYDFKWKIIPNRIIYPAIIIVFIYNALNAFKLENLEVFAIPVITASSVFLFFFLIYFFSKGYAMGLGDAKLAFLIGLFLNPSSAISAFTLAFIIGAVFGIILIGFGQIFPSYQKWELKSQIAFGPFLVFGATIAFFLSNFINNFIIF